MEMLRVTSDHDLLKAFGVSRERAKELDDFMAHLMPNTAQHSETCARVWNNEVLTFNEKVYVTFVYGTIIGKMQVTKRIHDRIFGPDKL